MIPHGNNSDSEKTHTQLLHSACEYGSDFACKWDREMHSISMIVAEARQVKGTFFSI